MSHVAHSCWFSFSLLIFFAYLLIDPRKYSICICTRKSIYCYLTLYRSAICMCVCVYINWFFLCVFHVCTSGYVYVRVLVFIVYMRDYMGESPAGNGSTRFVERSGSITSFSAKTSIRLFPQLFSRLGRTSSFSLRRSILHGIFSLSLSLPSSLSRNSLITFSAVANCTKMLRLINPNCTQTAVQEQIENILEHA